ncbi:MAG TPA: hypothetical protein VGN97_22860 [Mesorhizobium sp.]|jgi:hypothetical protein|nr:hypothetical protein [Mesorhizobium sp.]
MTDTVRGSREWANSAFAKMQTASLAKGRLVSEQDQADAARVSKTQRLRALRLKKEANDLARS